MSDLSRHIPLIALTVLFAVSMYYVYRSLSSVSHRVESLSQELYYGLNSVTELSAKLEGSASPSNVSSTAAPRETVIAPNDVLVSGMSSPDDAQSIESADIIVTGGRANLDACQIDEVGTFSNDGSGNLDSESITGNVLKNKKKASQSVVRPKEKSPTTNMHVDQSSQTPNLYVDAPMAESVDPQDVAMDDVNAYIGKLEEKFVNRNNHGAEGNNDDDDAGSVGSEISSISALNGKKRVPPYAAKNFPLGHRQEHNGKMFEVIKTKGNSIRWGKAMPMTSAEEAPEEA